MVLTKLRALPLCAALLVLGCTDVPAPSGSPVAPTAPTPSPSAEVQPVDAAIVREACQFGAVVLDVGPVALCNAAVALAIERLGPLHWPITSIQFVLSLCPPGAPCAAPTEKEGWVIFTFATGDPVMVHVGPALAAAGVDGPLIPDAPQQLPAWLADQLAGHPGP